MDRYLLLVTWREGKFRSVAGGEMESGTEASSLESTEKQPHLTATNIYHLLKRSINESIHPDDSTFPACSVGGTPHSRKWFFAAQAICGFYQVIAVSERLTYYTALHESTLFNAAF